MRKSRIQSFLISAIFGCGLWIAPAPVSAESLDALRERATELARAVSKQSQELAETSQLLDRLSAEIHSMKRKQEKAPTLLRQYRLQTHLQAAQTVSDRLSDMTAARREVEKELQNVQKLLARKLDQTIESRRGVANSSSESWKNRSLAARELELLLVERMQISLGPASGSFPTNAASLLRNGVSQEDARERLDALKDLEHRMENEIAFLESELSEVRRQRFLRNELTHLMDEEAFFAEQGFVRGGASRTDKGTAATNLTKPAPPTKETPVAPETVASPSKGGGEPPLSESPAAGASPPEPKPESSVASVEPAPPAAAPPVNAKAPAENPAGSALSQPPDTAAPPLQGSPSTIENLPKLDPSITTPLMKETSSEKAQRDPLAALANEFGLPPEQKRDVQARSSTSDGQVQWLENRISTIRLILDRLRQKGRDLEQKPVRP